MVLLQTKYIEIGEGTFSINIVTPQKWVRELHINGTKAYDIGPVCDTCEFLFERNSTAPNRDFHEVLPNALRTGLKELADGLIKSTASIMPSGAYHAGLHRLNPRLVAPNDPDDYFIKEQISLWGLDRYFGLPNSPRTKYYRSQTKPIGNKALFCEFIVPLFPPHWLDEDVVQGYEERLVDGDEPTALAISVLDIRSPEPDFGDLPEDIDTHWCLAHYLLDGHHKVFAASQSERPITLLSFLSVDHGIASRDQTQTLLDVILRKEPN